MGGLSMTNIDDFVQDFKEHIESPTLLSKENIVDPLDPKYWYEQYMALSTIYAEWWD